MPATSRKPVRRRKSKSSPRPTWLSLWPLLLGIIATPFAVRAASVLALTGPSALRVLYPFAVLVQAQAEHFSLEQADTLSQWILYGQFPLYGLLWIVAARVFKGPAGPLTVLLVHAAAVVAAIFAAAH
jgi:hypothetical protein